MPLRTDSKGFESVEPRPDVTQSRHPAYIEALSNEPGGETSRRHRRGALALRSRLLILVVASVIPLVSMGVIREYLDFKAEKAGAYDRQLLIARGMALAVERELQLNVSSLQTLATSPALQSEDLITFDDQAKSFLTHQPPGTLLGLSTIDQSPLRVYGQNSTTPHPLAPRNASRISHIVFETGQPAVTNLDVQSGKDASGFSVDVPVFRHGTVVYNLFMRLRPERIQNLIDREHLPSQTILSVTDTAGVLVARVPDAEQFVGKRVVPRLWDEIQANAEGTLTVSTLDGITAIAAYTHVATFSWAVAVGAPEQIVLAPLRGAMLRVGITGAIVLTAGLIMAMVFARSITRPIDQLRTLAITDDRTDVARSATTGLPETDVVARALLTAAAERQEAAKALAESETRFRALFERSPCGTILLDPESTQVIDSNEVAASTFGYSIADFCSHRLTDFVFQTDPDHFLEICRSVAAGGTMRYETRARGRDGPRDILIALAPVRVSGRMLVLLNQIDITDLRNAEAGLRINEERLELAREGANLGIWDWDVVNRTLTWSDQQWYLHGMQQTPDGLTPDAWTKMVDPADLARVMQDLTAALKSPDRSYATEYTVLLPDGSRRRLIGRGQTIRGPNGRALRMVGINMDVTARYEAEQARDQLIQMLQNERARLSDVIDALPIGVGILDPSGRILHGNSAMKRLTGPVLQSMTPVPIGEWIGFDVNGNRIAPENYPVRRALRKGDTTFPGLDFQFRDPDGQETWYRVAAQPLRWEIGKVVEALLVLQDINAEKRLLEFQQQINARLEQRVLDEMTAREAAQQRAAQAERMHALGQIAGGIAHDFNNVLQAVSGGAALIERRPNDPERVLRNARMVTDAARRGAAITSRLLAFSRRGDLRAENIDVAALLTDIGEVLDHTLGGSVLCLINVPPGLPALFADRGQLETVLVNLATNARDAMQGGGTLTMAADTESITVGMHHPAGLAPGTYVRIDVTDTGSGMAPTVLARATEPFFTTKEPGKGTGLGLAMAKGFAEQSGGSLSIDSEVDRGTQITLWLPIASGEIPAFIQAPGITPKTATDHPHVLLVDDDPLVRDVLVASLQDAGYRVWATDSGAAAMTWLESGEPTDIIVSDLTMPEVDGVAVIRSAQKLRPNLPAILLTGYIGDGATLAVGETLTGTFALLRKPVSGPQLTDRINGLLLSRQLLKQDHPRRIANRAGITQPNKE